MDIYVGNLHSNASETQIKDLFKEFGSVQVKVPMDGNGKSKGYALVTISNRYDGQRAIQALHQQNFMNQFIEVTEVSQRNTQRPTRRRNNNKGNGRKGQP